VAAKTGPYKRVSPLFFTAPQLLLLVSGKPLSFLLMDPSLSCKEVVVSQPPSVKMILSDVHKGRFLVASRHLLVDFD
jgi:hypothetical protein